MYDRKARCLGVHILLSSPPLFMACSGGQAFTSGAVRPAQTNPPQPQPQPQPQPAPPSIEPPPPAIAPPQVQIPKDCGPHGVTQAKLLTEQIANGDAGNFVEYEIFVTDCDGNIQTVSADTLLFDIDAHKITSSSNDVLRYELFTPQGIVAGTLQRVTGSDLFGKVGARYFHHRTDQRIALQTARAPLKLRINLGGALYRPFNAGSIPLSASIATYLRFGQTTPVRNDVEFVRR